MPWFLGRKVSSRARKFCDDGRSRRDGVMRLLKRKLRSAAELTGSLENLSLRRARFDSGDYPKCQPWACIKAKNAPRIPATNPMMVTTVFHLRRRGETRGELARSAEAFR